MFVLYASCSFAAVTWVDVDLDETITATTPDAFSFSLSNNVKAIYGTFSVHDGFMLATTNDKGDKVYATASNLTKIYDRNIADEAAVITFNILKTNLPDPETASESEWSGSVWSAL